MAGIWRRFLDAAQSFVPVGSVGRKLLQLVAVVLLFEGVAVVLLSSYFGFIVGMSSIAIGSFILWLYPPRIESLPVVTAERAGEERRETYGILLVDYLFRVLGGVYAAVPIGMAIIVGVILYNLYASPRPDIGDFDTLSIMLGGILIIYPYASRYYKVETCFALIFLAIIVVVLVIPEVVMAMSGPNESQVANWYVHYMLAAPMAGGLNLLGVEATSQAELVTIIFRDGSTNPIGISTACSGLYSFSIFVAAFSSFILVLQRLPLKATALVLGLGLLAAYLGNLVRMIIIGLVGYYHGMDALLWTHQYAGWVIFLGWSTVFWYAVIRYGDRKLSKTPA